MFELKNYYPINKLNYYPIKLACIDQQNNKFICFTIDRDEQIMSRCTELYCLADVVQYIWDNSIDDVLFDIGFGQLKMIEERLWFGANVHRVNREQIDIMNKEKLTLYGLHEYIYKYKIVDID